MSINHKIITLDNNKKYFVLEEISYEDNNYSLILNIDDETDINIVSIKEENEKIKISDINDSKLNSELSKLFKTSIEESIKMYS